MIKGLRVEMDFRANRATMAEVMDFVERAATANPDREFYMSGTAYAIVSKPKRRMDALEGSLGIDPVSKVASLDDYLEGDE